MACCSVPAVRRGGLITRGLVNHRRGRRPLPSSASRWHLTKGPIAAILVGLWLVALWHEREARRRCLAQVGGGAGVWVWPAGSSGCIAVRRCFVDTTSDAGIWSTCRRVVPRVPPMDFYARMFMRASSRGADRVAMRGHIPPLEARRARSAVGGRAVALDSGRPATFTLVSFRSNRYIYPAAPAAACWPSVVVVCIGRSGGASSLRRARPRPGRADLRGLGGSCGRHCRALRCRSESCRHSARGDGYVVSPSSSP